MEKDYTFWDFQSLRVVRPDLWRAIVAEIQLNIWSTVEEQLEGALTFLTKERGKAVQDIWTNLFIKDVRFNGMEAIDFKSDCYKNELNLQSVRMTLS